MTNLPVVAGLAAFAATMAEAKRHSDQPSFGRAVFAAAIFGGLSYFLEAYMGEPEQSDEAIRIPRYEPTPLQAPVAPPLRPRPPDGPPVGSMPIPPHDVLTIKPRPVEEATLNQQQKDFLAEYLPRRRSENWGRT